ncbi:MAG: class D sortase [Clostridiales bacterium]|nr:class D sortase [Clostridiales bacterium]
MKTNSEKRLSKSYRAGFLILPLVFFIVGYLTIYFVLSPFIEPVKSIYSIAFSDAVTDGSQGKDMLSEYRSDNSGSDKVIKASTIHFPYVGDKFGEITIESIGIKDLPLIYGDNRKLLLKGACLSERSRLPGYGEGSLIGAHKYSFFHELEYIEKGAEVKVETYYGSFVYKVYDTKIINVKQDDSYWNDLYGGHGKEVILLYSCYVSDTIRSTDYRFFAFCELVSGPHIDEYS